MGYTVLLEDGDLRCRTKADAEAAAAVLNGDPLLSPYHMAVSLVCRSNPPDDANWELELDHFQGDHWDDERAQRIWLSLAPHLADGATLEFADQDLVRWRIRWEGGRVFEEYVTEVIWAVARELTATHEEVAP